MPALLRRLKRLRNFTAVAGMVLLPAAFWFQGGPDFMIKAFEEGVMKCSSRLGLTVQDILVEGRVETSAQDLFKALRIHQGDPLLKCSPEDNKKQLEKLPWVQAATVQRRWPGTIYIRLSEKQPVALWQNQSKLFLIDERGAVIGQQAGGFPYADLLVVVGRGAPQHTAELLKELDKIPKLKVQVTAAVFVGERRWDLILNHKLKVKLPEEGLEKALRHLLELEQSKQIIQNEILAVDLRLPDRSFLIISPDAVMREEKIKETQT
ncbi:MAG: cell division protein FtsQ/DivIB [Sulfobacillus sp.]